MSVFTFVAVIVIASLVVGAFNEYQKNKLRFQGSNKQLGDLKDEIKSLKKRIENLEIIAVSDPDNFQDRARNIRVDDISSDPAESNQKLVNELARKKQGVS